MAILKIIMKKCIWCSRSEVKTSFNNLAHTVPKTLGGKNICKNVCDDCNSYFGCFHNTLPPIETVLKETFNISRARFLDAKNEIGKNKTLPRFSSIYFKVDFVKRKIELNNKYKFHSAFQEKICLQLKRGIYKMYLEELERQKGLAHDSKYDFIREFSRYNFNLVEDYPLIYFRRRHPMILMTDEWTQSPEVIIDDNRFSYLINESSFFEFEFLGHVFGIATSKYWRLSFDNYIHNSMIAKNRFFKDYIFVEKFNDIDLTLSILNN
jgi:hypothetical protein